MANQHSPLPWDHYDGEIFTRAEIHVGFVERPSNAEFIVRAVNSHEALLAALKEMREAMAAMLRVVALHESTMAEQFGDEIARLGIAEGFGVRAQAAIAKAEAS